MLERKHEQMPNQVGLKMEAEVQSGFLRECFKLQVTLDDKDVAVAFPRERWGPLQPRCCT